MCIILLEKLRKIKKLTVLLKEQLGEQLSLSAKLTPGGWRTEDELGSLSAISGRPSGGDGPKEHSLDIHLGGRWSWTLRVQNSNQMLLDWYQ
jgi:hypothetical protein